MAFQNAGLKPSFFRSFPGLSKVSPLAFSVLCSLAWSQDRTESPQKSVQGHNGRFLIDS
jgi:hypothetical protein